MKLSEFLKSKREFFRYNQEEMAERIGISFPSYKRYEKGATVPQGKSANKIASFFNLSDNELNDMLDKAHKFGIKTQPVTNMIAAIKRNRIKLLEELEGSNKAINKVRTKVTDKIDDAIASLATLLVLEELFFD
jgi:transcriptional regulator with XRE-family HTH domain